MSNTNIKYTNDGKKVLVVGKLNAQETIVQEIFISNDNEIPSGENFVVKSLHDAPAVSWKEKNLKDLEERYEKERKHYEDSLEKNRKLYEGKIELLKEKMSYLGKVIDKASEKSFEMVSDFLLGNINYVIESTYSPEIIEYKDFRCDYDKAKFKLLSLFGNDDGTLNWRLHSYSDGSGSSKECYFFKNMEDAIGKCKEILLSKETYSVDNLEIAKKYGIELDAAKVKECKDRMIAGYDKNIEQSNASQKKWEEDKLKIQSL